MHGIRRGFSSGVVYFNAQFVAVILRAVRNLNARSPNSDAISLNERIDNDFFIIVKKTALSRTCGMNHINCYNCALKYQI